MTSAIRSVFVMDETKFDFGVTLSMLRSGERVCRTGWNGNGMYIFLEKGFPEGIKVSRQTSDAMGVQEDTVCRLLPYIMMRTVDGSYVPWLASQTDILANDWMVADVSK